MSLPELTLAVDRGRLRAARRAGRRCASRSRPTTTPGSRCTRSPCRPRSTSSRPSGATTPSTATASATCSARPTAGRPRRTAFVWSRVDAAGAELHRARRVRPADALHLRPRGGGHEVPGLPRGRRGAPGLPLLRHGPLPRRRGPAADDPVPWSESAHFGLPVSVWREMIDAPLPAQRLGAPARRHAGRPAPRGPPTGGCRRWRRASSTCSASGGRSRDRGSRRGAGRLARLRGLRALPVHARRDQERHADAVRHRLPAGLRGRATPAPSTTSSARCGSPARSASPRRCASCGRRATGHRRAGAPRWPWRGALRAPPRSTRTGCDGVADPGARRRASSRCGSRTRPTPGRARSRRSAAGTRMISTHVVAAAPGGRFLSPLEAEGCEQREHLAGARRRRTTT